MSKIKNLDDLRETVLVAIEDLSARRIDTNEAGIIAKLSETVISGLKTQIEYARLTEQMPSIPFLGACTRVIEQRKENRLLESKKPDGKALKGKKTG